MHSGHPTLPGRGRRRGRPRLKKSDAIAPDAGGRFQAAAANPRLYVFQDFPVQYHAPVYRELAGLARGCGKGSVKVFYGTDETVRGRYDPGFGQVVAWDEDLLGGYDHEILRTGAGYREILGLLLRDRPAAVYLPQLNSRCCRAAYLGCLLLAIPLWFRTETQDVAFARTPAKEFLRSIYYHAIYAPVARFFAIGELNREHYRRHGIGPERIGFARYCVIDRHGWYSADGRKAARSEIRELLRLGPGRTVLLFVGKLQPKKDPGRILEALALLSPSERSRFAVVYVGTGSEEADLKTRAHHIPETEVRFAGFQNQGRIWPYYLAGDVLILPSRQMGETWGLVVNEALLAELRVILSPWVGCLADFQALPSVRSFDGTALGLAQALRNLPPPGASVRNRAFMQNYSVERAAASIWEALDQRSDEVL